MTLYILRGVPGSGKSTWANKQTGLIVSADHFMINAHGEYVFDAKKLGDAHRACFFIAYKHFASVNKNDDIIIDNTNLCAWEFAPYASLAENAGIDIVIHIFSGGHQNVHGVPESVVEAMRKKLLQPLPFKFMGMEKKYDLDI